MIPVSLKFKGIYSYQEEQFIDFERLTDAQLFGIFGAVGSGKSTILETISFAIYGETERLNKRDNRDYNMMNLKSDELFIEFIFRAGKKNKEQFKFVVNGKRNNKKFEDVKAFSRSAYIKKKGDWKPIEDNAAEDILGLSYQNFRRAIIIPQGKFQEFLQLKSKDRTLMLKEIFGLERFELYDKVVVIKNNIEMEINDAEARLDQIGEAGESFIKKNEKTLDKKEKEAGAIEITLKEKVDAHNEMSRIKKRHEMVAKAEEELGVYKRDELEFKKRSMAFNQYRNCKANFRDLFDHKKGKEENVEEAKEKIVEYKERFKGLENKRNVDEKVFRELEVKHEKKDEIKRRGDDLRRMVDVKNVEKNKEGIERKLVLATRELKGKKERLEEVKKEKTAARKELADEKKKAPESIDLLGVQKWFGKKEMIEKSVKDAEKGKNEKGKRIERMEKEKDALVNEKDIRGYFSDKSDIRTFEKAPGVLEGALNNIKKEIKSLENKIRPLRLRQQMSEVASELHKGEPCPLCGAREHPWPLKPGDIARQVEKEKVAFEELKERHAKVKETIIEINILNKQKKDLQKEFKEDDGILEGFLSELRSHVKAFNFNGFSSTDKKLLAEKIEANKIAAKKIKEREQEVNQTEEKLERTEQDMRKCQSEYDSLKSELNSSVVKIDTLKKEISDDIGAEDWKKEPSEIEKEAKVLKKELEVLADEYAKKKKEVSSIKSSINELNGTIKKSEEVVKKDIEELRKTEEVIKDRLEKNGYKKTAEVEKILEKEIDEKGEGALINKFWKSLEATKMKLEGARKEAGTKKYDTKKHEKVNQEIKVLNDNKNAVNQTIGELRNKIREHKKNLSEKKRLNKKLKKMKIREENIKVLAGMFRSNGFVNYVSTVYLQNFCRVANERFYKLTRQSMKLRLEEDNDFCVQDFMNEGKIRNIKTLSGGELFQASLALAVALSDSIQGKFGNRQNFFFLDEGFGSQDKDSLQDVFYALKTMRKENRIVGIISHVEGLQEEIDTHLKTIKNEDTGSHIKTSWE
ncbi:MAG: hypothetical protein NG740_03165 [Omnitrophica bacterium]|nr:hypothetical protein [Candidatus Omnitrophota bacterium]